MSKRRATRRELLDALNLHYPDGYLAIYYDSDGWEKDGSGDTLAQFIVREALEVLDPNGETKDNVDEIDRAMERAIADIEMARRGLQKLMEAANVLSPQR